jgi:hypothetical protein
MSVVYFFSQYAMNYGDSGIQQYIFDHQAFITADEITSGLNRLGPEGVLYYSNMYLSGLDFLYPLSFCLFGFLVIAKAIRGAKKYSVLLFVPPALFVADSIENLIVLAILNAYPEQVWGYSFLGYAVAVKTGLKWLLYALLLLSLCSLAIHKFGKSGKQDAATS